ncbi:universal stress [Micractinium conductrix]|uniref:Universal stress n=1 Tax=Micractinium conductrix TaxID=554055 RepID=A0A2P6VS78_9CHLO|nr:universal stress [Micractinium conductrix]|eukprot:PSC76927.1 universal stress [Micractinium conductrix]
MPAGRQQRRRAAPARAAAAEPPPPPPLQASEQLAGGAAAAAAAAAAPPPGRKFVFAVDGKPECEEALRWAVSNIFSKGDTVYLAHCLSDPRTPATAVGSSSAATQWSPARDEQRYAKEFFLRMEHEGSAMLQGRYVPLLQFKGVHHEELLLRLKVHRSAAGIAEAICGKAAGLGADAVVIASHGVGVLADFGSVARWAAEHSKVPALLLPPATMDPLAAGKPAAPAVVVAGSDNLQALRGSFEWALHKMARPGDDVYVMHAEQLVSDEDAIAARKRLVQAVFEWQAASSAAAASTVNVICDIVQGSSVPDESMAEPEGESGAGAQLCKLSTDLNARCVALSHHGAGMMRELLWGHVTMHMTKFCTRALVVLEPQHTAAVQAAKEA